MISLGHADVELGVRRNLKRFAGARLLPLIAAVELVLARAAHGKGEKKIPIRSISAVQWKEPGALVNGFIQFTILGGTEVTARHGNRTISAGNDENSVVITKPQAAAIEGGFYFKNAKTALVLGEVRGVVIAAFVLTVAPELLRSFAEYRVLLFGILMVLMMIWRPRGLIRISRTGVQPRKGVLANVEGA